MILAYEVPREFQINRRPNDFSEANSDNRVLSSYNGNTDIKLLCPESKLAMNDP
jgi:hypothetical protein